MDKIEEGPRAIKAKSTNCFPKGGIDGDISPIKMTVRIARTFAPKALKRSATVKERNHER